MHDKRDRYQVSTIGKTMPQRSPSSQAAAARRKRLGDYLIEAGLLTKSQVDVALNDQQMTEMKFGEILAARGWVKQQTVEFVMAKVVMPERKAIEHRERVRRDQANDMIAGMTQNQARTHIQSNQTQIQSGRTQIQTDQDIPRNTASATSDAPADRSQGQTFVRREAPIAKPLPPVKSNDGDVNWVG
jgi:hypothetical protein